MCLPRLPLCAPSRRIARRPPERPSPLAPSLTLGPDGTHAPPNLATHAATDGYDPYWGYRYPYGYYDPWLIGGGVVGGLLIADLMWM